MKDRAIGWRAALFGALVCAYIGLSLVAYTDYGGPSSNSRLTKSERAGLEVWRKNNCQVCHQIYGFGGFIGPDLTNVIDHRHADSDFFPILTKGYKKMPALNLSEEDCVNVIAFLHAVNRTGRSQPRMNLGERLVDPKLHWKSLMEQSDLQDKNPAVVRGGEIVTNFSCGSCHVPFMQGAHRAPDLTAAAFDRSPQRIFSTLRKSQGVMPEFECTEQEASDISAFLEWFADHRSELVENNERMLARKGFSWRDLQWWEYK